MVSETLWSDILAHVRSRYPELARGWFPQLMPVAMQHGVLEVQAGTRSQHQYLAQHCLTAFTEAAQAVTRRLVSVRFLPPAPGSEVAEEPLAFEVETGTLHLNPEYTFENFVVGPCNRLAHAASVAVAESPGTTYNPLFVHGNVGLGKTHLLQAACHRIRENQPEAKILYFSCETFTNHFIEAIERGALHQFRYRYRYADVLVIDDVQFLGARERSQEEFFHTFNTLFQAQKQIVLSADTPPKEIAGIEDRLISRFGWGLVVRIDRPCLETRIAIVQKKAKMKCLSLPDEVSYYIASVIDSNTRELEGAINKVNAVAQQYGGRIDLEIARLALGDDTAARRTEVSVPQILDTVVRHFNVRLSDLQGKKRSKSIAFARQLCMYLARELTPLSLEEIGKCLGGRDHTTVLHATRLIRQARASDPELDRTLTRLTEELRQR